MARIFKINPNNYLKTGFYQLSFCVFIVFVLFQVSCEQKQATSPELNEASIQVKDPYTFQKIPSSSSGIFFKNTVEETFENFFDFFAYIYNGGGVGVGDINNDGLQDIYFTGNEVSNKLYLNKGDFKFEDITDKAGVGGGNGWHNGVTMVDINKDGNLDIYVCRGGWQDTDEERANLLFINNGDLTFTESAQKFGLDEKGYSNHASFFDFDNDMDLDVYIMNRPDSFYLPLSAQAGRRLNPPAHSRDKLYINNNGSFEEIGISAGITGNYGYGLSVSTADFNKDGYVDIFVANDYAEGDYLYENQGNGKFKQVMEKAANHISLFSMGSDVADINNDGWEDILVMEMRPEDYVRSKVSMPPMDIKGFYARVEEGMHKQFMHNMLHLNQGDMKFSDVAQYAGIAKTDWSWACLAADFDNDGYKDLFVSNGYRRDLFDGDVQDRLDAYMVANKNRFKTPEAVLGEGFKGIINSYKPVKIKNYFYHNTGKLKFEKISSAWQQLDESFSHGAIVADLDNDGDLDLVVNNLEDEAFVYENTNGNDNNYLRIKLLGPGGNPDGIGGKITVYHDNKIQYFENKTVRGYLSSNESISHFGLAKSEKIDSIMVEWPDGKINSIQNIASNQLLTINYQDATPHKALPGKVSVPIFEESTKQWLSTGFKHQENTFDEYEKQTLLPHMFSKLGPFMAVGDVNGDSMEDFYIGGASGQAGSLYLQTSSKFMPQRVESFISDSKYEDMGALFLDIDMDDDLDLYVVSGGAEYEEGHEMNQDRIYINNGKGKFTKGELPVTGSSGSCVAANDFDGDGDLDLFVGGQVIKDNYPTPPQSYLLVNENGQLQDKTVELAADLQRIGMVNTAIWLDLSGDGKSELVIAGEWMPIKVFSYQNGRMQDVSDEYGLANTEGWWNKLYAVDIDGDGDQDILAGNLGENYKFKTSIEEPFQVFAKDFDDNGTNDIFLSKHYANNLVPVRGLECSSQQMPILKRKFPTFRAFANSSLPQIIGQDLTNALNYKAYLFTSIILVNENGKLIPQPLPAEAQFSTINSFVIDDFNHDGKQDMLIAGNRFDVEVETTPADASQGLLLTSIADNQWASIYPYQSGLYIPYNVKDTKLIKTQKGKILLVASNDDILRIFNIE